MKTYFTLFFSILISNSLLSQVGINTNNPAALLHLEPTNAATPSTTDGILIPRVSQLPSLGVTKGQLLFLNVAIPNQGFYYWTGATWQKIADEVADNTIDESIYMVQGSGYVFQNANITTENPLVFNSIVAKTPTGFDFPSSNTLRIGKTGTYLVSLISPLKLNSTSFVTTYRGTFTYRLKKNGTTVIISSTSVPSEPLTATTVSMSNIISFNAGDLVTATVQKADETGASVMFYSGYGNNVISLTFLHD